MIPLKIALHGLIALVPTFNPDLGLNSMVALLVDAREIHGGECEMEHNPKLKFVAANNECLRLGCKPTARICDCRALTGMDISLRFVPELPNNLGAVPIESHAIPGVLPRNSEEAGDFSYVANLAQKPFNLSLDRGYLESSPSADLLEHLVARMEVPFESITSCDLGSRADGGVAYVHAMGFRRLSDPSYEEEPSQAVAQSVILQLNIPDESTKVWMVFRDFNDSTGVNAKEILLVPRESEYKIDLSNNPDAPLERDAPCDDGIARHFAMYYHMAEKSPNEPLLPHLRFTISRRKQDIEPKVCKDPYFGLVDRPICPIGSFNP